MSRLCVRRGLGRPLERVVKVPIGQLPAMRDNCHHTPGYYEREHLLMPASKSDSGYRLYDGESVRRIRFIKQAQQCGFTLSEIAQLLALRYRPSARCGDVRKLAVEKKQQLEARIRRMKTMSKALDRLILDCAVPTRRVDECPILSALDRADGAT